MKVLSFCFLLACLISCTTESNKTVEFKIIEKKIFYSSGGTWCQCLFDKMNINLSPNEGVFIWKNSDSIQIAIGAHSSGGCAGFEQTEVINKDTLSLTYNAIGCVLDTSAAEVYYWKYKINGIEKIYLKTQNDNLISISEIKNQDNCRSECGI